MWNKLIDIKPKLNDRYFVCTKQNEVLVLDYNVKYDDFGYDFSYGKWNLFRLIKMI